MEKLNTEIQENIWSDIEWKENKWESTEKRINTMQKNQEKQKERTIDERVEETFWELEWKIFKAWDRINFMYMNENWEKNNCSFDVSNQTIEYNGSTYDIQLPKWASLTNVEFMNWEVLMKWEVWWFSWEWKASYIKLLSALDEAFNKWTTIISTMDWGEIKINKKA